MPCMSLILSICLLQSINNRPNNLNVTLLALLDLSVAFDCVNHDISLSCLQSSFGPDGIILAWIWSFLADTYQPACLFRWSPDIRLLFGIPQGSVLGPSLGNWNFHSHVLSLAPKSESTIGGTFAPWYFRSLELSLPGAKVTWNFRSQELSLPGTFAPECDK